MTQEEPLVPHHALDPSLTHKHLSTWFAIRASLSQERDTNSHFLSGRSLPQDFDLFRTELFVDLAPIGTFLVAERPILILFATTLRDQRESEQD